MEDVWKDAQETFWKTGGPKEVPMKVSQYSKLPQQAETSVSCPPLAPCGRILSQLATG